MTKPIRRVFDERGRCLLCGADAKGDLNHEHAGHEVKAEQLRLRRLIELQRGWFARSTAALKMVVADGADLAAVRERVQAVLNGSTDLKLAMKEDDERC